MSKFFVTGTDTEIGKTYISVGLLKAFNQLGYSTIGMKPLAIGCIREEGQLRNEDALAVQKVSSVKLDYAKINPFALASIGGYLDATLTVNALVDKSQCALNHPANVHVIEGAGGWHVPLNNHETMADYVKYLRLAVILVVGIRVGGLSHTILTAQAIRAANLPFAGWVANCMDPTMQENQGYVGLLKKWLPEPCLGMVAYQQRPETVLDVSRLMG